MSTPTRCLIGLVAAAALVFPAAAAPGHDHDHDHAPKTPTTAKPAAKPPVKLPAGVVARVNGQNITRPEMIATLDKLGGQPLLREMINNAVVEQEAKRLGVTVTPAELQKKVKEAKDNIVTQLMMSGTPMTFEQYAARDGVSTGLLEWSVRRQLLAQKAYAKSIEKNVPTLDTQIQASHILIATVPLPSPANPNPTPVPEDAAKREEEAKKKIDDILAEINAGKITFAEAAKKYSDDKGSGAQGGSLGGWFARGMMDPAFETAAFALAKPGDVSQPVKSQFGYHLIRLDKKGADQPAAEKTKWRQDLIAQQSQDPNGLRAWMMDLTQKAQIVTNPQAAVAAPAKPAPAKTAAPARKATKQ